MPRRSFPVVLLLGFGLGLGCAQEELRPAAAPTSPSPWSASAEPSPPIVQQEPPSDARPRLSRTITLGQDDYSPNAPRPAATQAQATTIINNNVIVQSPPIYGGYYGGYGAYGGYGGYGGAGASNTNHGDGRTGVGAGSRGAWAPSGWEGAQRTAAPGQTPRVGGNWAPPPSVGPAPMK